MLFLFVFIFSLSELRAASASTFDMGNACISHEAQGAPHQYTASSSSNSRCQQRQFHHTMVAEMPADTLTYHNVDSTVTFATPPTQRPPSAVAEIPYDARTTSDPRRSSVATNATTSSVASARWDTVPPDDDIPKKQFGSLLPPLRDRRDNVDASSSRGDEPSQHSSHSTHQQSSVQGMASTQSCCSNASRGSHAAFSLRSASGEESVSGNASHNASLLATPRHGEGRGSGGGSLAGGINELLLPAEYDSTMMVAAQGQTRSKDSECLGVFLQGLPSLAKPQHFFPSQQGERHLPSRRCSSSVVAASALAPSITSPRRRADDDDDDYRGRMPIEYTGGEMSLQTHGLPTQGSMSGWWSHTEGPAPPGALSSGAEDCAMALPQFSSLRV